jgi:hypothetical protein
LKKHIRMHILLDEPLRKTLVQAAHDSWMSVGRYIRETVALFKGAHYDTASDWVMIGQEIGIDGFDNLRNMAMRKGITVNDLCLKLGKNKTEAIDSDSQNKKDVDQMSLF